MLQNFLDLYVVPLDKQMAREPFEGDNLRVSHQVLETVAEVEKAFEAAQASVELLAFRSTVVETASAVPPGKALEIGLWVANGKVWVKGVILSGVAAARISPSFGVR